MTMFLNITRVFYRQCVVHYRLCLETESQWVASAQFIKQIHTQTHTLLHKHITY